MLRLLYTIAVLAPIGAVADYTATQGVGSTVFSFVCSSTKICPAMVLIDSTNVEKATAGNPLRVDPTGSTPQPVSNAGTFAVQDATLATDIGAPGATACATDTTSCSTNQQMQRLAQRLSTMITALGSPFQAGGSIGNTTFTATQATGTNLHMVCDSGCSGSGGTSIADNAAFTQGTTNETPIGCFFTSGAYSAITTAHLGVLQCDSTGRLKVIVDSATGLADGSTSSGQTFSKVGANVTAANPTYTTAQTNPASMDVKGNIRVVLGGGIPETASATGTTGATTATLATAAATTTYICGFSIRANATAAATGNATVTGTITGTMNFTQWTAPNASGVGVTEEIFNPCIPASAVNTSIAVVSAAPGTGGVVSVSAWGYQQ